MPPHAFPQYPTNIPPMNGISSGHQIPMLSDLNQNPEEIQQQPLRAIPPTPSDCLPQTGGVDWAIVASCSPEELAETNDIDTLSAIIQSFVHAEFTQTEAQLMPNPLTAKFFRILQIGIQYLLDCQSQLKESLQDSDKTVSQLKTKMKALSAALVRAKDASKKNERISESTEKCIVCGRRFKNVSYLDGHVQRRHGALMPAWRSLRTGQLQGMEDFVEQIEILRQEVAKTHRELERRAERVPVSHIVSHSDEQIKLMNELVKKQDEMMSQARELEDKQLNFRREMRNQLDDAVMALQEAQKKLDVQSSRISQIPSMPPPSKEPFRPDELGESLTEQLMKPSLNKQRVAFELDALANDLPPPPFQAPPLKLNLNIDNAEPEKQSTTQTTTGSPGVIKVTTGAPQGTTTTSQVTPQGTIGTTPQGTSGQSGPIKTLKLDDSEVSTVTTATTEDSADSGKSQREKIHDNILSQLADQGEEPIKKKPVERVYTKKEQIIRLIQHARRLGEHEIDPNESPNRDISISTITADVLKRVDQKLAEMKRARPYAALSVPFIAKKMDQGTKDYRSTYDQLNAFVGSEVPAISDEFKKNLFKARKAKFPLIPPIALLKAKQSPKKGQTKGGLPKIPEKIMKDAGKKLPYKQRMSKNRPRLLPGDSDVDIVEYFSSEFTSSESVGYREDPDFYLRTKRKERAKLNKEIKELHLSSSSSNIIQPLEDEEEQIKVFDMNQFASSTSSESEKTEEIDDGRTKVLTLKGANKTKTMKLQDDGSTDFDVTKKQSTKTADSDDLFDLSDENTDISSDIELTKKVRNTSLTELDDDSDDL
ncbi:hypothetical protein TRFO_41728 [Tritrichomonas foetus]|uniref:C2H2-type domain-containing protein n=1 Tax=Tritrichomonas foetus TaxID=1144522 RepID=A0A1J4KZA5_9EUKA|nr:hypothetical protein TRFO_41728 [Tritrichomonas foetus]|eukprot:OHT16585.1 hypothetical protein TRFO_41728 [Tritrichomonas foetus]